MTVAKEAGLLYGAIAMATDYDCWKESEDVVCTSDVLAVFKKNVSRVTDLLVKAVELIGQENWDQKIDDLKVNIMYQQYHYYVRLMNIHQNLFFIIFILSETI